MNKLPYHKRPKSLKTQSEFMQKEWPDFRLKMLSTEIVSWVGDIQPQNARYTIEVIWNHTTKKLPYVLLLNPKLKPRNEGKYDEIPHLIFNSADPVNSALCLFDPAKAQWTSAMIIANTTIPWASKWLQFYEFWLYCGDWKGGGVGYESVAAARSQSVLE